ncbi:MAG TPA: DUF2911 domain-containing protein [Terriglobales bacterium]|nr:DUF2911 domain-containing protein [Terriglobales bacterium]
MRRVISSFLMLTCALVGWGMAQDNPAAATVTCNFDENSQLVVEYQPAAVNLKKPLSAQIPYGRVWAPGGKPMTLFTNTEVQIGPRLLPMGAYTMFVIPSAKQQWMLVISKSTDMSGAYNEDDDLTRVPMESGELASPEPALNVSLGHTAPNQCTIRVDLGKDGHFTAFEKR